MTLSPEYRLDAVSRPEALLASASLSAVIAVDTYPAAHRAFPEGGQGLFIPSDILRLQAAAHDAASRHEALVRRVRDEAGRAGITRLRMRLADALTARIAADNALARARGQ